ncbi:hypothetical protein, partial [Listeria welshimeri]|uniref:hypothetical protein n=1 Tax=Listeria welshimeri TaxID=1643 RepID=UPI001E5D5952
FLHFNFTHLGTPFLSLALFLIITPGTPSFCERFMNKNRLHELDEVNKLASDGIFCAKKHFDVESQSVLY